MEQTGTERAAENAAGRESVRDILYIAVFAAIIAVLAQVSIPLPAGVPLTLQTLAVPLAGMILGKRRGTIATVIYVLLGAVGVPVFANLSGGLGIVLGMTGGFIISFPLMAYLAGYGMETASRSSGIRAQIPMWAGLVSGALINYAVGTVWFMIIAHTDLTAALMGCVVPFIPTAILKIILAGLLGPILRKALVRARLL